MSVKFGIHEQPACDVYDFHVSRRTWILSCSPEISPLMTFTIHSWILKIWTFTSLFWSYRLPYGYYTFTENKNSVIDMYKVLYKVLYLGQSHLKETWAGFEMNYYVRLSFFEMCWHWIGGRSEVWMLTTLSKIPHLTSMWPLNWWLNKRPITVLRKLLID